MCCTGRRVGRGADLADAGARAPRGRRWHAWTLISSCAVSARSISASDGVGEPLVADHDDRVEAMGAGAQFAAVGRRSGRFGMRDYRAIRTGFLTSKRSKHRAGTWLQRHVERPLRPAREGARATARARPTSCSRSTSATGSSRPGSVVVDLGAAPGRLVAGGGEEGRRRAGGWSRSTCSRWSRCPGVDVHPGRFHRRRRRSRAVEARARRGAGRPCAFRHGPQPVGHRG